MSERGRRNINLYIPRRKTELIDKLERIAIQERRSRSEVILMILENEIDWYVENPALLAQGSTAE